MLQLNPAHVAEQRRVQGRRRVKTDALDLEAITELVLAGRGMPGPGRTDALEELRALAWHRSRRVLARTAVKNHLLGQLDRTFPASLGHWPTCWAPGSDAWSPRISPTPIVWPPSERTDSFSSPRTGGCTCPGRSRPGW